MAGAGQPVLPAQLLLYRRLPLFWPSVLPEEHILRPQSGAVCCRPVHAGLSRRAVPGKYADRGILVLFISWSF